MRRFPRSQNQVGQWTSANSRLLIACPSHQSVMRKRMKNYMNFWMKWKPMELPCVKQHHDFSLVGPVPWVMELLSIFIRMGPSRALFRSIKAAIGSSGNIRMGCSCRNPEELPSHSKDLSHVILCSISISNQNFLQLFHMNVCVRTN